MDRNIGIKSKKKSQNAQRLALVIGNATYENLPPLQNPQADATRISKSLKQLDFEVITHINLQKKHMAKAIADFKRRLKEGSISLFYYAGHGIQLDGVNYLVPIETELEEEYEVEHDTIDIKRVTDAMAKAQTAMNIVILDACRDNPFRKRFRSCTRGLASMTADQSIIIYAAGPGELADDGTDGNGLFTGCLLQELESADDREIVDIMRCVTNNVYTKTSGRQNPYISLCGIREPFYFRKTNIALLQQQIIENARRDAEKQAEEIRRNILESVQRIENSNNKVVQRVSEPVVDKKLKTAKANNIADFEYVGTKEYTVGGVSNKVDEYIHETGMEFVKIPAGKFMMGSDSEYDFSKPMHEVSMKEYLLSKYVVTQGVWKKVMENEPWKREKYVREGEKYPAVGISWEEAIAFCKKTGLSLPSEAQWEYGCRGGTTSKYYWGDKINGDYLWFRKNTWNKGKEYAQEVGLKKANGYGLYDMLGNVWEWCEDEWHSNYKGAPVDGSVWGDKSLGASYRVVRGGSFRSSAEDCSCAYRVGRAPSDRFSNLGFRVCGPAPLGT